MLRRTLLAAMGASALPIAMPRQAAAATTNGPDPTTGSVADPWKAEFAAARTRDPRLISYESAPLDGFRADAEPLEGRNPAGLKGVLLRTGPARHEVGPLRYRHWFNGDEMVQRFSLGEAGVSHRGRYVPRNSSPRRRPERCWRRPSAPHRRASRRRAGQTR